jgi:hypothetical protein
MRARVRQFFATDPRPPSERDFLWSFVIFVVGMTFLAGAQVVLYPGQGKEGFDLKAVLDGLLVGQNYLAVLLVCCLVMLIYRRGYLRGLEHGRAAERVRRQELRSAVRPLR